MSHVLVLNGPNIDLVGQREPHIYGHITYEQINREILSQAALYKNKFRLTIEQHNSESELINSIRLASQNGTELIIFNPAAYTHNGLVLRDTLLAVQIPFIEVHLTQPLARESFRHHSFFSDIAIGTISGFGYHGYILAINHANEYFISKKNAIFKNNLNLFLTKNKIIFLKKIPHCFTFDLLYSESEF